MNEPQQKIESLRNELRQVDEEMITADSLMLIDNMFELTHRRAEIVIEINELETKI